MARDPKGPKQGNETELGDISARLNDISARLAAEKKQTEQQENAPKEYRGAADYSKGYRLITEFAAGILVGGAIGYGLDRLLGTTPWLLIVFLLLGFVAGVMSMWRADQKSRLSPEELAKLPKVADEDEDK